MLTSLEGWISPLPAEHSNAAMKDTKEIEKHVKYGVSWLL